MFIWWDFVTKNYFRFCDVLPALCDETDDGGNITTPKITAGQQANMQLAAFAVTMAIAIAGGVITGYILKLVAVFQRYPQKAKSVTML